MPHYQDNNHTYAKAYFPFSRHYQDQNWQRKGQTPCLCHFCFLPPCSVFHFYCKEYLLMYNLNGSFDFVVHKLGYFFILNERRNHLEHQIFLVSDAIGSALNQTNLVV